MGYKEAKITFYSDKITYVGDPFEGISAEPTGSPAWDEVVEKELEIMMSWEAPIMERSAEFVCENGGDILEIGFGMGIASDYIQAQSPNSHTILELHPELAQKAREWAEDKPSVTIIEGDWIETISSLGKFDGIFFDTYGLFGHWLDVAEAIDSHANKGCHVSFWNATAKQDGTHCGFDDSYNITYERIELEEVPYNDYYPYSFYYMPKVVL